MTEQKLSEKKVKAALDALSWPLLRAHLDEIGMSASIFETLLGHLRRSPNLLLKYPNPRREQKRDVLYAELVQYTADRLGAAESAKLDELQQLFGFIEAGYRGILRLLAKCDISRLPLQARIPAYIERANEQYGLLREKVLALAVKGEAFDAKSDLLLVDESGRQYPADAQLDAVVTTLTSTLVMEAYPLDDWKVKEPFYTIGKAIRQKAFEGLLPIWARRPSSNLFEAVPPKFWRNHDLEPGYCILPEVTDCWVKVTHPLLVGEVPHARTAIWTDFMTSREAIEALWPASSDVSS